MLQAEEAPESSAVDTADVAKIDDDGDIQQGEVLTDTISFQAKTQSGKIYPLNSVELTCTIFQVKQMIAKQDGKVEASQIKLILKGKPLTNENITIEEANIGEGSTVFVIKDLSINSDEMEQQGVSIKIERTAESERGLIRFRVPENGVGRIVSIVPPGGGPAVRVRVPPNMRVGQLMQFRLPDQNTPSPAATPPPAPAPSTGSVPPPTNIMKAMAPLGSRPGQKIRVRAPDGHPSAGFTLEVAIPPGTRPGEYFKFKLPTTLPH